MKRENAEQLPLAIVGAGCRFAGADNLEEFWKIVRKRHCAITELPSSYLDQSLYFDPRKGQVGKTYSRIGGVVPERVLSTARLSVAAELRDRSDVVHLKFLDVVAEAVERAGWDPDQLRGSRTGVYVGHARSSALWGENALVTHAEEILQSLQQVRSWQQLDETLRRDVLQQTLDTVRSQHLPREEVYRKDLETGRIATLAAEVFGCNGPALAIDAACASSFLALSQAANALRRGVIEQAIVGGASHSNWYSLVMFSHAQALSASGSFPFDERADGFVSSDGYAAILLKTLPKALADGDPILGVIRGIGVSTDGRGKSLWAPRKEGQIAAIQRAYGRHLDVESMGHVEAHGTSTRVGDATELEALAEELGRRLPAGRRIPVSSVKANIGHSRETAGLAGLLKTLMILKHGVIPAATGFETPNPDIPWDHIPFFVPREEIAWPDEGRVRRAAVESFGIGGLNAHVVVDDRVSEASKASVSVPDNLISEVNEPVAVIGAGAIFPGARTINDFRKLVAAGTSAWSDVPTDRWDTKFFQPLDSEASDRAVVRRAGFITDFDYDWRRHHIPPKQVECADPLQFMLLDAVDQAFQDAAEGGSRAKGELLAPTIRRETSIVVGTMMQGDFSIQLNLAMRIPELQQALRAACMAHGVGAEVIDAVVTQFGETCLTLNHSLEDETGSYTSSTLASRLAKTLDLMGGAFTLDGGGLSAAAAMGCAFDQLQQRQVDQVVCAAGFRGLDICNWELLGARDLLRPNPQGGTQQSGAEGVILGEGAGVVLLKRLSDARRDGDRVLAVLRGYGAALESDSSKAVATAAQRAVSDSNIAAQEVGYLETTSSGAAALEKSEADGLSSVFNNGARTEPLFTGSITPQIGFGQSVAGMAGLLRLTTAFADRRLPATPTAEGVVFPTANVPMTAGLSSQALRPIAYHWIVNSPPVPVATITPAPITWRIVRFGADSTESLATILSEAATENAAAWQSAARSTFSATDTQRLAIVAENADELRSKLALAQTQFQNSAARQVLEEQGIFVGEPSARRPRVAFVFSGQGSQYAGMFRELTAQSTTAARVLADLDQQLSSLSLPTFAELAWQNADALGHDLFSTQLSVLLADVLAFRVLRDCGLRPDVLSHHSFGKYAALVAANVWSLETAIQATRRRCDMIAACESARGVLLSTSASWEQSEQFVREVGGEIYLANGNAPDQTVLGGRAEDIDRLAARLVDAGLQAKRIPVPAPFHTPLMAECQPLFDAAIADLALSPPSTLLLSSVTNRYVADPIEIRANLIAQFVQPVRFVELSQRLVADGCDMLIEVGPRQVVSRLLRRCVPSADVAIISFDNPKRPGLEALLRVQALFEVRGGVCEQTHAATNTVIQRATPSRSHRTTAQRAPTRPIFFDATTARREKRAETMETPSVVAASADKAEAVVDELQSLLVNFVCEQTGYPPELVTMDADLEADLGIDSIKKAQLLGELREVFVFQQPVANLSLSDFPTLRAMHEFLKDSPRRENEPTSPTKTVGTVPSAAPSTAAKHSDQSHSHKAASTSTTHQPAARVATTSGHRPERLPPDRTDWQRLNVAFFRGSARDIGRQHGAHARDTIREAIHAYADHFGGKAMEVTPLAQALELQREYIPPIGIDELEGMAEGCGMPVERLIGFNFGIGFEHVAGCSQIAIPAKANGQHGLIHAINEDLMLSLLLGDKLRRLVQVRHPDEGFPHVLFSTSGQLGGFNGFNQAGLCITSTFLMDRFQPGLPAPGWLHEIVVQTLLQKTSNVADATRMLREIPRCGAWSLCLSDRHADRLVYLEYDGNQLWEREPAKGCFFSTNHALLAEHNVPVLEGSRYRYERLDEIFSANGQDGHSAEFVKSVLNDVYDRERGRVVRHPTMNTILRADTQASIVMCPGADEVWVTQNFKSSADKVRDFTRLSMSELFDIAEQPADDEPDNSRVMRRFVLRTADQPLTDAPTSTWNLYGSVVVVGEGKLASELTRRLSASGLSVTTLAITADPDSAVAEFERQCAGEFPLSVIVADEATLTTDDTELSRGLTIYRVLQSWLSKLPDDQLARGTLIGLTSVGTDFGWTSPVAHHLSGGVAGLCKALQREFVALRVLVLDTPIGEPVPLVVAALQRELDTATRDLEVSWVRQRRRAVQALVRRPRPVAGSSPRRNGTWIITGGARGITFAVARELAKRYGLKLHLLGSSPHPHVNDEARQAFESDSKGLRTRTIREARQAGAEPNSVWKNLERSLEIDRNLRLLEADGIAATYHSTDVSDGEAIERLLDEVRRIDGPIHGVLHGAGVEEGSRFARKRPDRVAATLNVKVGGALHLMRLLANDPLEHFVGFGSISGRFGNVGQSDYSMASDWLAKVVGRLRTERPSVCATTFHWPAWDEVGMAARPESRVVLEAAGSRFLPLAEGCAYVIEELEAGCPESEILIVDDLHHFDLPGQTPRPDSRLLVATERRAVEFPLLTGVRECSSESLVAESRLDPTRDVFLTEHQFAGTPILPAAVGLELLAEAASLLMRRIPSGLANVEIVNGLRFSDARPQIVQVRATRNGQQVDCELTADFFHRDGRLIDPQRVFVRGTVLFESFPLNKATIAAPVTDAWRAMNYRTFDESVEQTSVFHGLPFRCLRDWARDGDFLFGRLMAAARSALSGSRSGSRWLLPSVLLDGCFQMAGIARRVIQGTTMSLPHGFTGLRWSRLPADGEECLCRARLLEHDDRFASLAIELVARDGQVLLELDRYRNVAAGAATTAINEPAIKSTSLKSSSEPAAVVGREER